MVSMIDAVTEIAKDVALIHASDVDREARFPAECIDALKSEGVLASGISTELGGQGLDINQQAALCRELARSCASSAMILGMHFIKTNSVLEWGADQDYFKNYLSAMVASPRLIASMTSEEGIGGDLRQSQSALNTQGKTFSIAKKSPSLSYVNEADDIVLTCRRHQEASNSEQVLVLLEQTQLEINITKSWNAMGMRGTCTHACEVSGEAGIEQIISQPFSDIATQTMIPDAHVIWSNIWLGIALDAYNKARKSVKKRFLKDDSKVPDSARLLSNLHDKVRLLQHSIDTSAEQYLKAKNAKDVKALRGMDFGLQVNSLKVNASRLSQEICLSAFELCGFAGYQKEGELSVECNIRDILSASVMVSNERLIDLNAARLLV